MYNVVSSFSENAKRYIMCFCAHGQSTEKTMEHTEIEWSMTEMKSDCIKSQRI